MANVTYHRRTEEAHQLIPPEGYTQSAYFEQELDALFSRYWLYAGMTDDLVAPGDYVTVQAGRYPLFVVRGNDGELRAFHNHCRHRGTQFLEGVLDLHHASTARIATRFTSEAT